MRWKYRNVCGAPTTSPVMRTGWTVMLAVGTIRLFFAETASGIPIE